MWNRIEIEEIFGLDKNLLPDLTVSGVSIDTRTLQSNDIFIALKGDHLDGHAYVQKAKELGASLAIVDRKLDVNIPQVVVPCTQKAMEKLGQAARRRASGKVIAVTGSVGKTSTKEILRQVLSCMGGVSCSVSSFNNHWGVPLSLARFSGAVPFGIFEIGMNHPGEIAPLSNQVQPHIAIITAIGAAHIGNMGTIKAIAEEKSDIFSGVVPGGTVILPRDSEYFDFMKDKARSFGISQIISFGKHPESDIHLEHYSLDDLARMAQVSAKIIGKSYAYNLPLIGEHFALNSLIVFAVAQALGLSYEAVTKALENLEPIAGRGKQYKIPLEKGHYTLIDDAYNANLISMTAGLTVLNSIPLSCSAKRIAILGEMLELGEFSHDHHMQIASQVKSSEIDLVYAVGAEMECLFEALPSEKKGGYALKAETLIPLVEKAIQPGDVVFVKGSKGSRVSLIVDFLLKKNSSTFDVSVA